MTTHTEAPGARLAVPVDAARDHILGPVAAPITLVEYGSYACPHCRAANERVLEVRAQRGDRMRYVFRHLPLLGNDLARRAAELAECASNTGQFWHVHEILMTRSESLTEDDLRVVAEDLGVKHQDPSELEAKTRAAREHVDEDVESARRSGVRFTPTFYINGSRYDGPWDESSISDTMRGALGQRARSAALHFASWAPSTGILLLVATILAMVLANSALGPAVEAFWHMPVGFEAGSVAFQMPLLEWINDGLLTVFFLVVGLEIKREFTVGSLSTARSAALPVAAALGGMLAPALLYLALIPDGPWAIGWGIPMATDTAFAVALIAVLGPRVPVELRVFLTAAAIVDDIGAITVVALVYTTGQQWVYLIGAVGVVVLLWLLNRSSIYRAFPYLVLGLALWFFVHAGGLHATLAGVLLAAFIPTRHPPNYRALAYQMDTIIRAELKRAGGELRYGPSETALRALDDIHDRLESPADRMLRTAGFRSSYVILPLFALANAGVAITPDVFEGRVALLLAIGVGLVIGKPLGFFAASALAVRLGLAEKPGAYSWRQLLGAGALAGIGFTMSLFIAGEALPVPGDFAAAKLAVFAASIISAIIGVAVLRNAPAAARTTRA